MKKIVIRTVEQFIEVFGKPETEDDRAYKCLKRIVEQGHVIRFQDSGKGYLEKLTIEDKE